MTNKIYVDVDGKYLGEFSSKNQTGKYVKNPALPSGAIEVSERPEHGDQIYNSSNSSWEYPLDIIKNKKISILKDYLSSTDWYVVRENDEPGTYPVEIKNKRISFRAGINEIESATTTEEVDTIYNNLTE